jgi:hypothetical protein
MNEAPSNVTIAGSAPTRVESRPTADRLSTGALVLTGFALLRRADQRITS